jgi:hypothetical protein
MSPDAPVAPDEAERLLLRELAEPVYREHGDSLLLVLWERFLAWLSDVLDVEPSGTLTGIAVVVTVVLAAALLLVVLWLAGPLRRRGRRRSATALAAEPEVTAAELLRRAEAAAASGRERETVLLAVRSLVRDLEERTLLPPAEGRTAHEAAEEAASWFPPLAGALRRTASAFDRAAYSRRPVGATAGDDALQLARYLSSARPDRDALPAAAEVTA